MAESVRFVPIIQIMKAIRILITAGAALFPVLLASCNKEEATTTTNIEASNARPYPIDTCLVSGEKLGSMGDPVVIVHEGREIKFCCDSCIPKFKKDSAKYIATLDAASGE